MSRDLASITHSNLSSIIPITINYEPKELRLTQKKKIDYKNFIWLGRLSEDFKFFSLKNLMLDLDKIASRSDEQYILDIVGDGPAKEKLLRVTPRLRWLEVNFLGEQTMQQFEALVLRKNYFAIVSMGTSVLEGARMGISSIIVMPMMTERDRNGISNYRLIYDSIGFSMGEFSDDDVQNNYSLEIAI